MRASRIGRVIATGLSAAFVVPPHAYALPVDADSCLSADTLPGADVVLLDQYGGRGATPAVELADSRHPTHMVKVESSESGKPMVLVVSAYEPTIWDVSSVSPDRLRAVVAYGYYPPGITGRSPATLVRFGKLAPNTDWRGSVGCKSISLAYSGTGQVGRYSNEILRVFGVSPSRYYGGYDPAGFNVDTGNAAVSRDSVRLKGDVILPDGAVSSPVASWRKARPPATWSNPVQTTVRWATDGSLITPATLGQTTLEGAALPASAPVLRQRIAPANNHRRDGIDLLLSLLGVGATGALGLAWYRNFPNRSRWSGSQPVRPDPWPTGETGRPSSSMLTLMALCTETDSKSAFERFSAEVELVDHAALDDDLRQEALTVTERDAAQLIAAACRALSVDDNPASTERASREAIVRLTTHLRDLREQQVRRNRDVLNTTQSFLRARYPTTHDSLSLQENKCIEC